MLNELRHKKVAFAELVAPLLDNAIAQVCGAWFDRTGKTVFEDFPNLDLNKSALWLADDLTSTLGPALLSRFNDYRPRRAALFPDLFDESVLYDQFVSGAFSPQGQNPTFDVPLARMAALRSCQHFANALVQLLERVEADSEALSKTLQVASPKVDLVEIRYGLSDRHAGGTTVCLLRYRDGSSIVYKPRSMAGEILFSQTLSLLNNSGLIKAPCSVLKIVDCGSYGWCESVGAQARISEDQARRFYYRAGVLCACADLLGSLIATTATLWPQESIRTS